MAWSWLNIDITFNFVAFCSFFPGSLTGFHKGRQLKSGGRQLKSSRAGQQNIVFHILGPHFSIKEITQNVTKHPVASCCIVA